MPPPASVPTVLAPLLKYGCQGQPIYDVLSTAAEATGSASASASSAAGSHEESPAGDHEISGVPAKDLSRLQPFELDGSLEKSMLELRSESEPEKLTAQAEALKDMGNVLFKLGDTGAAAEIFAGVLEGLEPPTRVGETYPPPAGQFRRVNARPEPLIAPSAGR